MRNLKNNWNRIIECGNFIEITKGIDPYFFVGNSKIRTHSPLEKKMRSQQSSINRSRRKVELLMLSNYREKTNDPLKPYTTHNVLTFAKNVNDRSLVKKEFKYFISRLNDSMKKIYKTTAEYITTIEYHESKRGFHLHLIFLNFYDELKKTIQKIWNKGRVEVKIINNTYDDVKYVANYICKDFFIMREFFPKEKLFITSMGLTRPKIIYSEKIPEFYRDQFKPYRKDGNVEIYIKKEKFTVDIDRFKTCIPNEEKRKKDTKEEKKYKDA